jgi:hypothetical protein
MSLGLYDRDGNPISHAEWSRLKFGTPGYDRVARTCAEDVTISTVWLGIDHGFGRSEHPILFETMVFGGALDEAQYRWTNEVAALAGHDQVVAMVREVLATGEGALPAEDENESLRPD